MGCAAEAQQGCQVTVIILMENGKNPVINPL
jgi:hypothetical protein